MRGMEVMVYDRPRPNATLRRDAANHLVTLFFHQSERQPPKRLDFEQLPSPSVWDHDNGIGQRITNPRFYN